MPEYRIAESRYEIRDTLPDGRVAYIDEVPGRADVHLLRGHATKAFCTRMNEMHKYILGQPFWVQVWEPGVPRLDGPAEGLGFGRARWELVPTGDVCTPIEREGAFVWLIREGHVSPQAVAQMNRYLQRIVGDGLWQQRWDG